MSIIPEGTIPARQSGRVWANIMLKNTSQSVQTMTLRLDLKRSGIWSTWKEGPRLAFEFWPGSEGFDVYNDLPMDWGTGVKVSVKIHFVEGNKILIQENDKLEVM